MPGSRVAVLAALLLAASNAAALNKQGARQDSDGPAPRFNLSGYVFAGGFLFNPSYAARPNNSGRALLRFGLHLDADLWRRYLTLSYDENSFTDQAAGGAGVLLPSEHDHILGLLSNLPLGHDLDLTLAVHYELDAPGVEASTAYRAAHPGYAAGYSQSYVDAYARLGFERGPWLLALAVGGFLWNPSYAARPDNAGLALLRYVLHGELAPLPWLALRLDLNFFTDRDEGGLVPTELDAVAEVAVRWRDFELRFAGEVDLPLGRYPEGGPHPATGPPGIRQMYLAALVQWNFDLAELLRARRTRVPSRPSSAPPS